MSLCARIGLAAALAGLASSPCLAMMPIEHFAGSRPTTGPGVHLGVLAARLAGTSADPVRPKPAPHGPMVTYDLTSAKGQNDHGAADALYDRPGDPDANPFMAPLDTAPAQGAR